MSNLVRSISRRAVLGTLATGGALLAAACGRAAPAEKSPAVKAGGKITWSFWAVSQEQADGILARLKEFHGERPGIQVEAMYSSAGVPYREKILAMVTAGTPPEVMQVDSFFMPEFVSKGIVQKLDPYIKADKSFRLDSYLPGGFMDRHQVHNGVTYGMPNQSESPRVIFYNKQRFLESGLTIPNTLDDQGKWTWDAYLEAATRLSKGASPERFFGTREYLGVNAEQHSWVYLNGGKVLSDDLKSFVGDMPETMAAWQFQADLVLKHRVAPPPGENLGAGNPFVTGRVAMFVSGLWAAAPFVNIPALDYAVAPLPKSPKGIRKTVLKPNALTMPTIVQGQPAATAWELMKFVAGPTFQKGLIRDGLAVTNLKELVDYFQKNTPVRNPKVFTDAFEKKEVTPLPLFPRWAEFSDAASEEFDKVRRGEASVQAAVGNLKPRVSGLLR